MPQAQNVVDMCVQPDAPWATCCVCGKRVKTCERKEPVPMWPGGEPCDYICPVHSEGFEFCDGRWVCSSACGEKIEDYFEGKVGFFWIKYFAISAFIRRTRLKVFRR